MINPKDPSSGYDSLLDTMTNVVGILILVLAVAYLVVRDTVNRVAMSEMKPNHSINNNVEYEKLKIESERLDDTLEQISEEWKIVNRDLQYKKAQLEPIQSKINKITNFLRHNDFSQINKQEEPQEILRIRVKILKLEDEVEMLKHQLKDAKSVLLSQSKLPKPKVTVLRVPDPVPAPLRAKRISFLCRYSRVVYYPADEMVQLLQNGIADATGSNLSNPKIRDFQKVIKYFDSHMIALGGLRWKLSVIQRNDKENTTYRDLKAYLEWTSSDVGETFEDVLKDNSKYNKIFSKFADRAIYVKFYVWGDSFPVYTVARNIADGKRIPAGWIAKEGDAEYILALSSTRTGKKKSSKPGRISHKSVPRIYTGGGGGGGASFNSTPGIGAIGVIGASPGGDFVD